MCTFTVRLVTFHNRTEIGGPADTFQTRRACARGKCRLQTEPLRNNQTFATTIPCDAGVTHVTSTGLFNAITKQLANTSIHFDVQIKKLGWGEKNAESKALGFKYNQGLLRPHSNFHYVPSVVSFLYANLVVLILGVSPQKLVVEGCAKTGCHRQHLKGACTRLHEALQDLCQQQTFVITVQDSVMSQQSHKNKGLFRSSSRNIESSYYQTEMFLGFFFVRETPQYVDA